MMRTESRGLRTERAEGIVLVKAEVILPSTPAICAAYEIYGTSGTSTVGT